MKRGGFVVCWLLLLATLSAAPQARGAKSDPISGTWTGALAPDGSSSPVGVTFQLKLDAENEVSGTFTGLPSPGDVKKGTFDPKSGALKLQLGKTGEDAVLLILDGTVAKGVATGHFSGEMGGDFKLSRKE
jgi:hypothetical protein